MIIENSGLENLKSELAHLDESAEQLGFLRWQWEYYRATYDLKIVNQPDDVDYLLRINTRAIEGKLEQPDAVLAIEAVYMGKPSYPHGLDYEAPIPESVVKSAKLKLDELKRLLS